MKSGLSLLVLIQSSFVIAQTWTQIGPSGGYFKEFTIHPANDSIVYAGSDDGGGVWKSTDQGNTWSLTTGNFPNMTGWKIVLDENAPDTLYACDLYGRYGVLKSTNGAMSWELKNTGLSTIYDKMVSGLVLKASDTLFISTGEGAGSTPPRPGNGVFSSYDGGASWQYAGLQGVTVPCIAKNSFGTIFAGTEGAGLYYTNDNGASWFVHPDVPTTGLINEMDVKDQVIVVASTEGIYLSLNWGINFTYVGLSGGLNFDVCIHKINPEIELYSSTLGGLQYFSSATNIWSSVPGPLFTDQLIIGITSDGTNLYTGGFSNSPVIRSTDGGLTWSETPTSPSALELNDILLDPADENHLWTCLLGSYSPTGNYDRPSVYETDDGGLTWTRKGPDAHALCMVANPQNPDVIYLGTFAQGLYKTSDGFDSYSNLSGPGQIAVSDIAVSPQDTSVVLLSEVDWSIPAFSIKRSTDGGQNFSTVSSLIANRIVFNPLYDDTVYVATNNGLYISANNGASFNFWNLSGHDFMTLAVAGNVVYAGTKDGDLFKIEDDIPSEISGSWNTPVEIKSILAQGDNLFVGLNGAEKDTVNVMQGSVWRSSNQGISWSNITTNMTSTNIYGNNVLVTDGAEIYAGTYGGGIFRSSGLQLNLGLDESTQHDFLVYPNPALDEIEIGGGIEAEPYFKILDMTGKDVTPLVQLGKKEEQNQYIQISALPSGTYILLLLDASGSTYQSRFVKM
ncbi:MAG: T9SS type A sorting domain-containing protein [Bacteroidetes bacterium]|nr:T9SS type A sorting domain-containing protein [Bacteroidota bacterium]